jgi:transposase
MSASVSAYLGIDIAKDTFAASRLIGKQSWHGSFANTPDGFTQLDHWLKKRQAQRVHACLEATGRYSEGLAEHLHAAGHTVSVINPARLKAYAAARLMRTKNDPIDAALLADFCRSQQPAAWTPPTPERRELRALVRRRESLLLQRQQEANRLSSGEDSRLVRGWLAASLAFLDEQLAQVEQAIRDQIADHPDLKRQHELIDSIPGIGPLTAAALLAELDFGLYPTARQVAAQAGLTPRQRQSGTSVHGKPRLSKQGARPVRARRALATLIELHGGTNDRVAVISHGGFYNHFMGALLNALPPYKLSYLMNNTGISRINLSPEGHYLVYQNRCEHLPAGMVTY